VEDGDGRPGDAAGEPGVAVPTRRTIPLPWMVALIVVLVLALVYTLLQLRP
jgi:hypothetical protein